LTTTTSIWITFLYVLTVASMVTRLNVDVMCDIRRIKYLEKWIIKLHNFSFISPAIHTDFRNLHYTVYVFWVPPNSFCYLNVNVTIVWMVPKNRDSSVHKVSRPTLTSSVLRRVTYSHLPHHFISPVLGPIWLPIQTGTRIFCLGLVRPSTWIKFRNLHFAYKPHKKNSVAVVRKRTIPTERSPLVGELSANVSGYRVLRGQRNEFPRPLISVF
jgi:hypothetical protein